MYVEEKVLEQNFFKHAIDMTELLEIRVLEPENCQEAHLPSWHGVNEQGKIQL